MSARHFLDTNIFVYTFDASAERKRDVATDLVAAALRDRAGIISFQVLQEFCSLATRKFAKVLTSVELREYIEGVLAPLCEVHSHTDLYMSCLSIREQTGYSFFDCLILAAAACGGCDTLYTEDLQDGQQVAGVRIVNPFYGLSAKGNSTVM